MIERILSKQQARAVLALVRERDEIARRANEQMAEVNAAIAEQAEILRAHFDLPDGKYEFTGDANEVKIRRAAEAGDADGQPTE